MVSLVFAVYDAAVKSYAQPFLMTTEGQALRGFMDACEDQKTNLAKHPEDYTLFKLGSYDDATGKYTNLHTPESLGGAIKFKKVELKAAQ